MAQIYLSSRMLSMMCYAHLIDAQLLLIFFSLCVFSILRYLLCAGAPSHRVRLCMRQMFHFCR